MVCEGRAATVYGGRAFRPGRSGSPKPHVPAPQPVSVVEMGAGPPVGSVAYGGQRARELRESVMTSGVGSGALGLRNALQILRQAWALGLRAGKSASSGAEAGRPLVAPQISWNFASG